jgi:hypothetical protein
MYWAGGMARCDQSCLDDFGGWFLYKNSSMAYTIQPLSIHYAIFFMFLAGTTFDLLWFVGKVQARF